MAEIGSNSFWLKKNIFIDTLKDVAIVGACQLVGKINVTGGDPVTLVDCWHKAKSF